MAPDADKLRNRRVAVQHDGIGEGQPAEVSALTLKSLRANEVVIDGIIYDIASFDHPGGDSINVFGGNDATVAYKMIHPYHTKTHVDKMKIVGKVPDYFCEYKFDTPFERELKKEVFQIVRRGKEFGTPGYMFRVVCYVTFFFYLQHLWMY